MVPPSVGDRAVHFRADELLVSNRAVLNSSKSGKRSRRMVRRQTLSGGSKHGREKGSSKNITQG